MRGPGLFSDLEGIHHAARAAAGQRWRWPVTIALLVVAALHALEVQLGVLWFAGVWTEAGAWHAVYVVAPALVAFAALGIVVPPLGRHIMSPSFVALGLLWLFMTLLVGLIAGWGALTAMRWWQTTALPVALAQLVVLAWLAWPTSRLQRRAAFGAVLAGVPALVAVVVAVPRIGAP